MESAEIRLLGVGDNCVDAYGPPVERRFPGGNVLNVVANWLLRGVRARYAGSVGDDRDGGLIRAGLAALGDDGAFLRTVPGGKTGVSRIALGATGEATVVDEAYGVSGEPPLTQELWAFVRRTRPLVHLSTNGGALRAVRFLRDTGAAFSLDVGDHWGELEAPERRALMSAARYVFVSAGPGPDDRTVDRLAAAMAREGPEVVLVGRGSRGVRGLYAGAVVSRPSLLEAPPVDSLGAGDALVAGVLAAAVRGASVDDQLREGLGWAADACRHLGAFSLPA